jgi:hypothetical protein
MLANADDPEAVEPPIVEEFRTDALGAGLRTMRYLRMDDGAVAGALNYAFRDEPLETDLRIFTACEDLARLQMAFSDIEELVRSARISPRKNTGG